MDFAHAYPITKKPMLVTMTNTINWMHYACRGDRRLTSEVAYTWVFALPRIGHLSEKQASTAGNMLDGEDERVIDMHFHWLGFFDLRA